MRPRTAENRMNLKLHFWEEEKCPRGIFPVPKRGHTLGLIRIFFRRRNDDHRFFEKKVQNDLNFVDAFVLLTSLQGQRER